MDGAQAMRSTRQLTAPPLLSLRLLTHCSCPAASCSAVQPLDSLRSLRLSPLLLSLLSSRLLSPLLLSCRVVSMSTKNSLRHVVRRREHRERAQPAARAARFGLLEKHKDYKLRANDYHRKEDALRVLKEKAAFKNDDEFYRNMHSAQTKGGVHSLTRSNDIAPKTLALMKAQDAAYLQMQRSADQTRINKAKKNLHFLMEDDEDEQAQESKAKRKTEDDDDEDDDDDNEDEEEEESGPAPKKSRTGTGAAPSAIRSRHVIFVDSVAKVENFSPAAYFQTTPELVKRKFNRLKTAQLESGNVIVNQTRGRNETAPAAAAAASSSSSAAASAPASAARASVAQSKAAIASAALLARSDQSLLASYSELNSRLDRKRKIETALDKLQLERLLSQKGRRKKIVGAEDKFGEVDEKRTVYKWKLERKK